MFSPMKDDYYDGYYPRRRYHQQVPPFGSWDCFQDVEDLSRCFDAARQAGYIRYDAPDRDLYDEDHVITPTMIVVPRPMARVGVEEDDAEDLLRLRGRKVDKGEKSWVMKRVEDGEEGLKNPKPVDEDLYKISPQLFHSIKSNSRRNNCQVQMMMKMKKKKKKNRGLWMKVFISCLVPCASS